MAATGDLALFKWQRTARVFRDELERFVREHATRGRSPPPPRRRETLTFQQQAALRALNGQISQHEAMRRFRVGRKTVLRSWSE